MSKTKRQERYEQAMKSKTIFEPLSYYFSDLNKNIKKIDAGDVQYEGVKAKTYLQQNIYLQKEKEIDKKEFDYIRSYLISFLLDKNYDTPNIEIKELLDDLHKLFIVLPTEKYHNILLDANGFVVGVNYLTGVLTKELETIPEDVDKGYYKFIDGEFIKDEDREKELEGVL